ncbi:MAG: hypothetical protein CM1200mP10_24370 [Candidatus Neomarinimicrobiota bacterium]|nr:MAG: hypothetical protein CM1200mP10_24370 [Candidatus Neomarinimicrobiota bacterium]
MNLSGYEFLRERLESEIGRTMVDKAKQLEKLGDTAGYRWSIWLWVGAYKIKM